jgi:hypothetical protein
MDGTPMLPETRLAVPLVEDYATIAKTMRPDEIAQFLAMSGMREYVPDIAAKAWINSPGPAFVVVDRDNKPLAVSGFTPVHDGVYEAWAAAPLRTWQRHWRAVTKYCVRQMSALLEADAHRIQICALATRTEAHAWYEKGLHMTREGLLRAYCADGSDAVMFARVRGS